MDNVLPLLQAARRELEPQFKSLKQIMSALQAAERLAAAGKADALPMQKALAKLEEAAAGGDSESLRAAVSAFSDATRSALDNLAFEFARDLRDEFTARGQNVEGRPPTLAVGLLTLNIDIAARKAQWLYGKEELTRPIPLSLTGILQAYDQQTKRIAGRSLNRDAFLRELFKAWEDTVAKRKVRPSGGRVNLVEAYSQLTLNRQNARFWNAPSRSTFKDYERPLFVRDLVLLEEQGATSLTVEGQVRPLKLGVATKSQAEQASRSIWLPRGGFDGEYYSDITFD